MALDTWHIVFFPSSIILHIDIIGYLLVVVLDVDSIDH